MQITWNYPTENIAKATPRFKYVIIAAYSGNANDPAIFSLILPAYLELITLRSLISSAARFVFDKAHEACKYVVVNDPARYGGNIASLPRQPGEGCRGLSNASRRDGLRTKQS